MEAYLERHLDFKIFPLDAGVYRDATLRPAHHILREMFDRVGVLESGEKNSHELLKNHWRFFLENITTMSQIENLISEYNLCTIMIGSCKSSD